MGTTEEGFLDLQVRRMGESWHQQCQELPKSELKQKQVAGDGARGCYPGCCVPSTHE